MDTKSKKSRPFLAWLCFFLGVNLLFSLALMSIISLERVVDNWQDFKSTVFHDFKASNPFKRDIAERLDRLILYVSDEYSDEQGQSSQLSRIREYEHEGQNLLYWANNTKTGKQITNATEKLTFNEEGQPILPEGYDYFLYFDGKNLKGQNDGLAFDVYDLDKGYLGILPQQYFKKEQMHPQWIQTQALLIVAEEIVDNPYSYSPIFSLYHNSLMMKRLVTGLGLLGLLCIILLILSVIMRRAKREFDSKIARVMGWFWIEVKLVLTVFALGIVGQLMFSSRSSAADAVSIMFLIIVFMICWWFYFILVDMIYNKRQFFTNNIITWLFRQYRGFERGKPFQKALMMRAFTFIGVELALAFLTVLVFIWGINGRGSGIPQTIALALLVGLAIYLVYRYLRRFGRTIGEFGQMIDQTERMSKGDFSSPTNLSSDSDIYEASQNLNLIQQGVMKATEDRLKSERMKIDLITNVSHDLKTPLTSIISYVELLSGEADLPDHVKDYIAILSKKSDRLKSLIQDIFDLSKVSSGAIDVEMKKLDLPKLIQQTLADMQDEISATTLTFKTQYSQEPIFIMGDGKKLYRVFQNLLTNSFKYALENSRVYVDVWMQDKKAFVSLKNIANYEMNFKETEILERFVRGDESRTTEGSGLGLAIAQGYVQAMGGDFKIKVDGDLFKVTLRFPLANE